MNAWTTKHHIEDYPLTVDGVVYLLHGMLTIAMVHDPNADCDADGHRGRDVTYEDERHWTLLSVEDADGNSINPIPQAVIIAAEAWSEQHELDDDGPPDDEEPPEREDR